MKNSGPEDKMKCKICNNTSGNTPYIFREILYEMKDTFEYFQCSNCGCMQIKKFPENISDYYPEKYGAYNKHRSVKESMGLLKYLKLRKSQHCIGKKKNLIGWMMQLLFTGGFVEKLKPAGVGLDDSILDVGTGTGGRLLDLKERGFRNLQGTDIFIPGDIFYDNGVKVFNTDLDGIKDSYDFIMLNHSFEHMPDPLRVMKELYRILKKGKYLLIRIPVIDSYSWKHYGENWMALDPPRHFFIHSRKSIEYLAGQANFELKEIIDDATENELIASEQIKLGIPVFSENSYLTDPNKSVFNSRQVRKFRRLAKKLNKSGQGETSCFYLYKA